MPVQLERLADHLRHEVAGGDGVDRARPRSAHSTASWRVRLMTPALDAWYEGFTYSDAPMPSIDEMLTMEAAAALEHVPAHRLGEGEHADEVDLDVVAEGPRWSRSRTACPSMSVTPALFTRMSMSPCAASASATTRRDVLLLGHVARVGGGLRCRGQRRRPAFLEQVLGAGGQRQRGAGLGQRLGPHEAEPVRAPCDERDLATEIDVERHAVGIPRLVKSGSNTNPRSVRRPTGTGSTTAPTAAGASRTGMALWTTMPVTRS